MTPNTPTIEELMARATNAFKMARAAKLRAWAIEVRAEKDR